MSSLQNYLRELERRQRQAIDRYNQEVQRNRLGFLTSVARRLAEKQGDSAKAEWLRSKESTLERSRLVLEDTLCHDSLTNAERQWLEKSRPAEAKYWRLLTDLAPEHLSYAS